MGLVLLVDVKYIMGDVGEYTATKYADHSQVLDNKRPRGGS